MDKEEKHYHAVASKIKGAIESQLFGKPCYKIKAKAFCCFFEKEMVFKLTDEDHADALSLDGSQLFDPSKKGRAMKEWVQVPFDYKKKWKKFAEAAAAYVAKQA